MSKLNFFLVCVVIHRRGISIGRFPWHLDLRLEICEWPGRFHKFRHFFVSARVVIENEMASVAVAPLNCLSKESLRRYNDFVTTSIGYLLQMSQPKIFNFPSFECVVSASK